MFTPASLCFPKPWDSAVDIVSAAPVAPVAPAYDWVFRALCTVIELVRTLFCVIDSIRAPPSPRPVVRSYVADLRSRRA